MDLLPIELRKKIFRMSTWQHRFVNLRLVNTDWYETVDFRDLKRFRVAIFKKASNRKSEELNRAWAEQLLIHALPVIGASLESFGFEIRRTPQYVRFVPARQARRLRPFDRYYAPDYGSYRIDDRLLQAIVMACPRLKEINFIGASVDPEAYHRLLQLKSTLNSLIMPHVISADLLAPVMIELHLRKLAVSGADALDLDTADNSSVYSLMMEDHPRRRDERRERDMLRRAMQGWHGHGAGAQWQAGMHMFPDDVQLPPGHPSAQAQIAATNRRLERLVSKFPNVRYHGGFELFSILDPSNNTMTSSTVIYSRLRELRHSGILDNEAEDCNLCIFKLAQLFPKLERLTLKGRQLACIDTVVAFPMMKHLKLKVDGSITCEQLAAILSLERLKSLIILDNARMRRKDEEWKKNVDVRCNKLEILRWDDGSVPETVMEKIFDTCPRLRVIASKSIDGTALIAYVNRLGHQCRLERLETVDCATANVWHLLSQPMPRLYRLSLNVDLDIYQKPAQPLIGCRHLKRLQFTSALSEYLILEAIINASISLEKLTAGRFENYGHPEMLFYSIGRHPTLRRAEICCFNRKPFEQHLESTLESLRYGRMVSVQTYGRPPTMRVCFSVSDYRDKLEPWLAPEIVDQLAKLDVFIA